MNILSWFFVGLIFFFEFIILSLLDKKENLERELLELAKKYEELKEQNE